MPNALRTATPMADWRSLKFTCEETAGMEGIKTAVNADAAAARHPWLWLIQDTVGAVLEDVEYGAEAVLIYHAEKIMVAKYATQVFLPGDRVYWNPTNRLCYSTYATAYFWIGIATEPAGNGDLQVEIDLKGDKAEIEAILP